MTIDPLAEKYKTWAPYVFSGNIVINARELEGLEPGILFGTMDDAAENFGTFYNDNSIRANQEYGSTIYEVTNTSGVTQYTYSVANIGTSGASVYVSSSPSGSTNVADIHTHAASTANAAVVYQDNVFSGAGTTPAANQASISGDIGDNNRTGLVGYVATPNGSLQKYDPSTGAIITQSTNLPSDAIDPARLNTVSSAASATTYTIQSGDNLTQIARRFDTTVSAITTENKISDPNRIRSGSTLTITN